MRFKLADYSMDLGAFTGLARKTCVFKELGNALQLARPLYIVVSKLSSWIFALLNGRYLRSEATECMHLGRAY